MTITPAQASALAAAQERKTGREVRVQPDAAAKAKGVVKRPKMNGLEWRYAEHLENLKITGQIRDYWFGRYTFKLADDTRYTPDFAVWLNDLTLRFDETKGFMRDDARVKLKVAASMFPHE